MHLSSWDPVGPSLTRMGRVLFRPWRFSHWVRLSFGHWLSGWFEDPVTNLMLLYVGMLGSMLLLISLNVNLDRLFSPFESLEAFSEFVNKHMAVILGSLLLGAVVLFGIYVAWRWLTSRGRFMFLRTAINPDLPVGAAWRETRELGNRLLKFRIYYDFVVGNIYLLILVLAGALAWPDICRLEYGSWAKAAVITGGILLALVSLAYAIFGHLLEYFILPLMLLDDGHPWPTCKLFFRQYFFPNLRAFCIYFLAQILITIILAMIAMAVSMITCRATYLVFVGNVLLLPLTLFYRYYNFHYLQQLAPQYVIYPNDPPPQYGFPVMMGNAPVTEAMGEAKGLG